MLLYSLGGTCSLFHVILLCIKASQFIQVIEERQGLKIGCIEEIAYCEGFIDAAQLASLAEGLTKSGYGQYLNGILKENT